MNSIDNQIINQQIKYYDSYLKIDDNPRYKQAWKFILSNREYGNKILDIGCANGGFSKYLIEQGFDCYGLEYSEDAIYKATKNGLKITKGSFIENFPFEDSTFDIIFAGEVIEHTIDDDFFLKECYRVLKPNGLIIITTPNLTSLGNRLLILFGKLPRFVYSPFHYKIYTLKLLKDTINKNNFKILKSSSSYILISTFFNKFIGYFGEKLGIIFPSLGEHIIIFAEKIKLEN